MKNIWISSDLHLNHVNILNFIDYHDQKVREFDNVNQINEHLLERHNSVVKPGDLYYCLGDVFFGDRDEFKGVWPKFNGKKRLICGNHDDIPFLSSGGFFSKVQLWRQFPEFELVMSHITLHESSLYRGKDNSAPMLNVHGHIHRLPSPSRMHYNVSVETLDNYTPVHIEDLAVIARKRRKGEENIMIFDLECQCESRYSIEPHGDGYALYYGRCKCRHGYNLVHLNEPALNFSPDHIEKLLNLGAAEYAKNPAGGHIKE